MATSQECAHEPCSCQAQGSREYCSDACESAAASESEDCSCGHAGCTASQESAERRRAAR